MALYMLMALYIKKGGPELVLTWPRARDRFVGEERGIRSLAASDRPAITHNAR
jgi:hypothetical protein